MKGKFLKGAAACLAAMMALSIVACGGGEDPADASAVKLTMYMYQPEDWAVDYITETIDDCNEEFKGEIKVEPKFFFGTQYNTNLAAAIENGTCPDIFTLSYSNLAANVTNGYLEPLNDYFTEEEWADIIPQSMAQVKFNDTIYAYPWYLEPSTLLYYRKDIVEDRLGFTAEDLLTYDGIYEVCRAMVNQNVVPRAGFPMYIPVGIPRGWATVGMQYNCMDGKYAVSDDWTQSNLGEAGMKDINRFYYTIGSNGWCPQQDMTERGYEDAVIGLCEEYWLMNLGGSWDITVIMREYPDMIDKIGVVPAPTSTQERNGYDYTTATNGGWSYVISADSSQTKKDAAAKVIHYLMTDSTERTAQYFLDSYNSRFATTNTVQEYLDSVPKETPSAWLDVVKKVAELGISEPRYSWDVINLVNDMLSASMACKSGSDFDAEYSKILSDANAKMQTILNRGETNPFLQS